MESSTELIHLPVLVCGIIPRDMSKHFLEWNNEIIDPV